MAANFSEEDYNNWFEKDLSTKDDINLKRAEYLWNEYQYRHDLIWNLVFRLTTAAVLLGIIPYIQPQLIARLEWPWKAWILAPPFLAIGLVAVGFHRIRKEMELLSHIRNLYRPLQDHLVGLRFHEFHDRCEKLTFNKDITAYLVVLLVLALANLVLVVFLLWLNQLESTTVVDAVERLVDAIERLL